MKLLGFTEEITTCGCCGKTELKGTYAFDNNGETSYFGSTCAQKVSKVDSELLKVAKMKSEYDLVAFRQDARVIPLIERVNQNISLEERKRLSKEIKGIKEEYKKIAA